MHKKLIKPPALPQPGEIPTLPPYGGGGVLVGGNGGARVGVGVHNPCAPTPGALWGSALSSAPPKNKTNNKIAIFFIIRALLGPVFLKQHAVFLRFVQPVATCFFFKTGRIGRTIIV